MKDKIARIIKKSLIQLYKKDKYLIDNQPDGVLELDKLHHVGERSVVFRFAHYLLNYIQKDDDFNGYDFDCEYNRNGINKKVLPSFPNGTYPDIIVHHRGDNDNNLLVIEVKTYWNSDTRDDERKIRELMSVTGEYKFQYGVSLLLGRTIEDVKINFIN